jgi:chromosome segregation ATPase
MSIRDILKTSVSSAKLHEQITGVEAEATALRAKVDQAESAAVAAAADPGAYAARSETARALAGELGLLDERLGRLARAYADTRQREQSDYVTRVQGQKGDIKAQRDRTCKAVASEIEAETERHAERLKVLDRKRTDAVRAVAAVDRVLRYATAGIPEDAVTEIDRLEAEISKVNENYPADLDTRWRQQDGEAVAARSRLQEAERHNGFIGDSQREYDAAQAKATGLGGQVRERNSELDSLRAQIADLEASATSAIS